MINLMPRQTLEQIDMVALQDTINKLKTILNSSMERTIPQLDEIIQTLLDFQLEDGSFSLLDSFRVPSDIRVDFCYMPTYIITSILIKYLVRNEKTELEHQLLKSIQGGIEVTTKRNLMGHGYEMIDGQIKALEIFYQGDVLLFFDKYPIESNNIKEIIYSILKEYKQNLYDHNTIFGFGSNYKKPFEDIIELYQFNENFVFVYGTLMHNNINHNLLKDSIFVNYGSIKGYQMQDNNIYPWIKKGQGYVLGEVYKIDISTLRNLDDLENQGILYQRSLERIRLCNGSHIYAYLYIKLHNENKESPIFPCDVYHWKKKTNYIWYLAYGSNILLDRFKLYITGEECKELNLQRRKPMSNKSYPIDELPYMVKHEMYFANYSSNWNNCGVSFLDMNHIGNSFGRLYLITKEQFIELHDKEGNIEDWYSNKFKVGEIGNIPIYTITNSEKRNYNKPDKSYLNVIKRG